MNNMIKLGCVVSGIALVAAGCMTTSLAKSDNVGDRWEKFKSYQSVPYAKLGYPTIDGIGQEFTIQSDLFVQDVVKPMIEADKEGYTGIVSQFMDDVADAKKDGKTENDVLQAWRDRYGDENIAKLGEAFATVRKLQAGKTAMAAVATQRLPKYLKLAQQMPQAQKEVKDGAKNPIQAAKSGGAAAQLADRVDALIWSARFVQILNADKAAETAALQEYVDSFKSKVN